jgi:hypothetical protein
MIIKKYSLGDICRELNFTIGRGNKPDMDYMLFNLRTPEIANDLKQYNFDIMATQHGRKVLNVHVTNYIFKIFNVDKSNK